MQKPFLIPFSIVISLSCLWPNNLAFAQFGGWLDEKQKNLGQIEQAVKEGNAKSKSQPQLSTNCGSDNPRICAKMQETAKRKAEAERRGKFSECGEYSPRMCAKMKANAKRKAEAKRQRQAQETERRGVEQERAEAEEAKRQAEAERQQQEGATEAKRQAEAERQRQEWEAEQLQGIPFSYSDIQAARSDIKGAAVEAQQKLEDLGRRLEKWNEIDPPKRRSDPRASGNVWQREILALITMAKDQQARDRAAVQRQERAAEAERQRQERAAEAERQRQEREAERRRVEQERAEAEEAKRRRVEQERAEAEEAERRQVEQEQQRLAKTFAAEIEHYWVAQQSIGRQQAEELSGNEQIIANVYARYLLLKDCYKAGEGGTHAYINDAQLTSIKRSMRAMDNRVEKENSDVDTDRAWKFAVKKYKQTLGRKWATFRDSSGFAYNGTLAQTCNLNMEQLKNDSSHAFSPESTS